MRNDKVTGLHEAITRRNEPLAIKAAQARSRSRALRAETVKVARQVAETEQFVADTMTRLASQHPGHARDFQAMSQEAGAQAVWQRNWAACHAEELAAEAGARRRDGLVVSSASPLGTPGRSSAKSR